jgi:alpha-1,2-mannosyltransferase
MAPTAAAPDHEIGPAAELGVVRGLLPLVAVGITALTVGATLAVAGDTLGYDFRAYHAAAVRILDGQPLYDASAAVAGPGGLFLYPPPFALLMLPLGLLPVEVATLVWIALLLAAFAAGTAVLPVSGTVRWTVVLLAGISWPFVYATKLGQVGAVLYLLFAVGWRWMDRPAAAGISGAIGTIVKVQPGLVLAWAALTRRWTALAIGIGALIAAAAISTLVLGPGVWGDYLTLLGRVNDSITTPHNFTPGAIAYQSGMPRDAAAILQFASTGAAAVLFVVAALRHPAVASYLAAVVVSQLVSPVAWDHYAMLLLLPVAWLLDRGHWWAVLVPLAMSLPLIGVIPAGVYPVSYWVVLLALIILGERDARPSRMARGAVTG